MLFLLAILMLHPGSSAAIDRVVPENKVVQIISRTEGQIGSGVILNSRIVVTNHHVLRGYELRDISIVDHQGIHYSTQKLLVQSEEVYLKNSLDYGFVVLSDAILHSKTEVATPSKQTATLTLVAYRNGKMFESSDSKNLRLSSTLLHCNHSLQGFSGGGVFNEFGKLVALHRGIYKMRHFCSGSEVSQSLPIDLILDSVPTLFPEALPYLNDVN